MQVTISWDSAQGDEPKEQALLALNGPMWQGVVQGLDQWMRDQLKYHEVPATLDQAREKLHELVGEHGLSLWE